ncbi:major facilitator superfamily domain-containing protein [Aspergillus carlsbadensis]|nr:major facilitator superfamily domain-containing protein [Aspergillus carlsbadensis]
MAEKRPEHDNQQPQNATPAPAPPPNGGIVAWLHTYYKLGALFRHTSSNILWIGFVQAFMLLVVGFITGPIYDRGFLRPLLILSSFGIVLLSQGFYISIKARCLFVPYISILLTYFSLRLGAAIRLATLGSSLGGIIYPIILKYLLEPLSFGWAVRVIGFRALGTLLLLIVVMKQRVKPPKARALIDATVFTDIPFMTLVLAGFLAFMGLFTIFFYILYVASARQLTSPDMAFYIVPILNAASCFGRTIPNTIANKLGPFNIIAPCCLMVGILILCMMTVVNKASLIVIAVLVGFFSGALIGLPPLCFIALTKDKSKIGTRIGMGFGMMAFGVLAGGPGSGDILGGAGELNWNGLWAFGGVSTLVGSLILAGLRLTKFGFGLRVKA